MHRAVLVAAALLGVSSNVSARPMPSQSLVPSATSAAAIYPSSQSSQYSVASATSAAPYHTGSVYPYTNGTSSAPKPTGTGSGFGFPLPNGFPNPSSAQLAAIEKQAQGTLPNGAPPPSLQADSETSLAFIAFNELFEVAFFTELLHNITTSAPGYTSSDVPDLEEVLSTLKAVKAQEELHELNANGAFNKFTGETIQPCRYNFPVDNFHDAIALASTFTDVVLATLPDIQTIFAENGDDGLIRGVGSVIGQEGEQNGFYRHLLNKLPPALPFLTGGARDFAFSAILQNFVVPGSCPSLNLLTSRGLQEFDVLNVLTTDFSLEDITAEFSLAAASPTDTSSPGYSYIQNPDQLNSGAFLTYINQQNVPISVPIKVSGTDETGAVKFTALFPGKSNDLNGLTIAAVTSSSGPFSTPDDVAAATLFGPGLIEV